MKLSLIIPALLLITCSACSQKKDIGGDMKEVTVGDGCEGCEAVFESPVTFENLGYTDTLPGFSLEEPKIEISGIVYKSDGTTPASGVVIYLYHTDRNGYYSQSADPKGMEKRHGKNRGWLKTNDKGEYKFFTFRPAPYPNAEFPAHIRPESRFPQTVHAEANRIPSPRRERKTGKQPRHHDPRGAPQPPVAAV